MQIKCYKSPISAKIRVLFCAIILVYTKEVLVRHFAGHGKELQPYRAQWKEYLQTCFCLDLSKVSFMLCISPQGDFTFFKNKIIFMSEHAKDCLDLLLM